MDLEKEKHLKALAFAYLWVAAADGEIHRSETQKFLSAISEHSEFDLNYTQVINDVFHDTKDHFVKDFDDAAHAAKLCIRDFKSSETVSREIIEVARLGIIADRQLKPQEELVIKEIAATLGHPNP